MREKLIILIQSAVSGCARYWAGLIADRLIAAGVVVPVRCKDCKKRYTPDCLMEYTYYSTDPDADPEGVNLEWTDDNGFCSYGERRTDGKK